MEYIKYITNKLANMSNVFVPENERDDLDSSCEVTLLSGTVSSPSSNTIRDPSFGDSFDQPNSNGIILNDEDRRPSRQGPGIMMPFASMFDAGDGDADADGPFAQVSNHDSPQHFSDQSTDGDSFTSDAYKRLIRRDLMPDSLSDRSPLSRRRLPPLPDYAPDLYGSSLDFDTAALDINLDFTVHVGKLAIYLKQLRFSTSRVDEYLSENRLKGKVKCLLLNPSKSQRAVTNLFEARPKDRTTLTVDFEEVFVFYLYPKHQIDGMTLQFKVCGCKRLFRDVMIAESFVRLGEIDLSAEMLPLTIHFNDFARDTDGRSRSGRRPVIVPKSGKLEVFISLQFIPENSKVVVDLRQSTKLGQLRDLTNREIIVQAELVSSTCECVQRKTTFLKMVSDNPGCNKPFEFELNSDQLLIYTLMLSVSYSANRWNQQERIGWIAFGRHCSGQVEAEHWDEMIAKSAIGEAADQWHCLLRNVAPHH